MRSPLVVLPFLLLLAALMISSTSSGSETANPAKAAITTIQAPISFEPAADGQFIGHQFIAHRPGGGVKFTPESIEFLLPAQRGRAAGLTMKLHGGSGLDIRTEAELPGKSNYLKGNDPAQWRTNIPTFARLRYSRVYPGIDLLFYGTGEDLEHDFIVEAGADPKQISLELQGAKRISTNAGGDLLIHLDDGDLMLKKPVGYQEIAGTRRKVNARFALSGNHVSFVLGNYDSGQRLIIDPVLSFSTFLGGSSFDQIDAMATDSAGNIYVTGTTSSPDFPLHLPEQSTCVGINLTGCNDAFVTKFDPTGSTLIYSTYLGGSGEDSASSIAVDPKGNVIVGGFTGDATNFPAVNPLVTGLPNGWFVASLSPTGASLNYSGVFNPAGGATVAVDSSGNAYVTGTSDGGGVRVTPGAVGGFFNPHSLFVMKINPTGALVYCGTILGTFVPPPFVPFPQNKNNFFPHAIAVDSTGAAYIAGTSLADDLPVTPGVIGPTFAGGKGFLVKVNPAGSAIIYATYLPGTATANALAVDSSGNTFLGGNAVNGLPVSANAFRKTVNTDGGYVLKLGPAATNVGFASYLGGDTSGSSINAIAVGVTGNLYVAGPTLDFRFPGVNALQRIFVPENQFVAALNSDASGLLFSTALGGNGTTNLNGIAVDSTGKITVAGTTNAHNFPTTGGSFQPVFPTVPTAAETHGMVAKIDPITPAGELCIAPIGLLFGPVLVNTSVQQPLTLINCGNADLHISGVSVTLPAYTASVNCPTIAPNTACTGTITYSPKVVAEDDGFLKVQHDGGVPNGFANSAAPPIVFGSASLNPPPNVMISGPTTATVKAGAAATYNLTVTPEFGFSGALSLGCQNLPAFSTCSVSPSSVTLSGSPVNFTVTVNTVTLAARNRVPGTRGAGMLFPFAFAPFAVIIVARRRKKLLPVLFAAMLALAMASCGGGNNPVPQPPPPTTPLGTTVPGIYNPMVTNSAGAQSSYTLTMIVQ